VPRLSCQGHYENNAFQVVFRRIVELEEIIHTKRQLEFKTLLDKLNQFGNAHNFSGGCKLSTYLVQPIFSDMVDHLFVADT